jgi:hypothetical protein
MLKSEVGMRNAEKRMGGATWQESILKGIIFTDTKRSFYFSPEANHF